jgi:hypothetical protein
MINDSPYFDGKDFAKLYVIFNEAIRVYGELKTEYLYWAMFQVYMNSKYEIDIAKGKKRKWL